MKTLSALLIDDEDSARSRLRRLLEPHREVEIIGEAADGLEAIASIERLSPDLVFLDVQMPGLNGFEVLRSLPESLPCPLVIFATAYDEYALKAFEANAVGYLMKPIRREDLERVLTRTRDLFSSQESRERELSKTREVLLSRAPKVTRIVVVEGSRYRLFAPDEIYYFRAEDGLVKAKTDEGLFRTGYRLAELEQSLPQPPFFLARRGVLVNLDQVKTIEPYFRSSYILILKDESTSEVQVSERQSIKLRERLDLG